MSRTITILIMLLLVPLTASFVSADCPLSRSPVLLPMAMPANLDCVYDEDGNGLDDDMEVAIAQCVVPEFRFDVGEPWWSLGPQEPHVLFNSVLDAIDGKDLHVTIRYGVVWAYDGGFATSGGACHDTDEHAGDTQNLTEAVWIRHTETGWSVQFEKIQVGTEGEDKWFFPNADPFIEMSDGHPVIYPSTGKHHWYVSAGEKDYSLWCGENAYGNLPPRVPIVEHVPNNIETLPVAEVQCGDFLCYHWCNACYLRKSMGCWAATRSLRRVDLFDWLFPDCLFTEDGCDDQNSEPGGWGHIAYPGIPRIMDPYFLSSPNAYPPDGVTGIWKLVQGGFPEDVDGDGYPFWLDICPVDASNGTDDDSDEIGSTCDPEPNNPNVYVAGGSAEYPALPTGPMAGFLDHPPVCDAGGPYVAECAGATTSVVLNGAYSSDPDPGDALSYSWTTLCPGGTFDYPHSATPMLTVDTSGMCMLNCNVNLEVKDLAGLRTNCNKTVYINDHSSPTIVCPANVTIQCDSSTDPSHTGFATAMDVCDLNPPTIHFTDLVPANKCAGSYTITRTWTAGDRCGNTSSCDQMVKLVDPVPPVIACNSLSAITPADAPISFTATATDNCDGAPRVEITGYDCFALTKEKMKRIDKKNSCKVKIDGATIRIIDSGGIDDHITWTTRATDCTGNSSTTLCSLNVVHP